jgi:hypothetical protein
MPFMSPNPTPKTASKPPTTVVSKCPLPDYISAGMPQETPERELGDGYKYVGLGCTFAGGILMFMAGGWALDRWLRLTPLFTIVGTLLGTVVSFLHVYWRLRDEEARQKRPRP